MIHVLKNIFYVVVEKGTRHKGSTMMQSIIAAAVGKKACFRKKQHQKVKN